MNKKIFNRVQLLKLLLAIPMFATMTLWADNHVESKEINNSTKTTRQTEETISVNKMVHDFGTIKESSQTASTIFILTNSGKEPLIINKVSASCGCTTPEWTKEPIEAGKQAYVKATYSTAGRPGPFDKTITVVSNGNPSSLILHIKGTVERDTKE